MCIRDRPYTVATVPWEIQKYHFSTVLFIRTSQYLRYLRRKRTVTPLPTTPKNVTALPCKMHKFSSFFIFFHAYRYQSMIRTSCRSVLLRHGAEFQQSLVDDAVDQWRKWLKECIRAEGIVTLNVCCDVACLTFHLPHITTGFFSEPLLPTHNRLFTEPPTLGGMQHTFNQMKKLSYLKNKKIKRWTFFSGTQCRFKPFLVFQWHLAMSVA